MRYDAVRGSHDAQIKPVDGSRSGVGHKIGVLVLSISALAAGAIHMISGSPNKPKNVKDAQTTLVKEIEKIFNPRKQDAEVYLESEQAINSPAMRVDILLFELTSTQAKLITLYNEYTKAVEADDGSAADKEQGLRGAVIKAALATLNGANMPEDSRAPLVLVRCKESVKVLEALYPQLPEICAAEIADLDPEHVAIEKLRKKTEGMTQSIDRSKEIQLFDPDYWYSARSIIDDFLKAHSQEKSNPEELSSANISVVGGG